MDHLASKVAEGITKWHSKKSILKLFKATTITVQDGETLKTYLHHRDRRLVVDQFCSDTTVGSRITIIAYARCNLMRKNGRIPLTVFSQADVVAVVVVAVCETYFPSLSRRLFTRPHTLKTLRK